MEENTLEAKREMKPTAKEAKLERAYPGQVEREVPSRPVFSAPDNWKHRAKGMICGPCRFFVESKADNPMRGEEGEPLFGRCRRHAPTMSGWPVMFGTDWCGDHKLDENKC